jgi:hypothetical protein
MLSLAAHEARFARVSSLRVQEILVPIMEMDMAKMYRVYSIIERPKQDDYWLNIGVAFPHDDGEGMNVILQALPLHGNGKIVLRAYDADKHAEEETVKQAQTKKTARN